MDPVLKLEPIPLKARVMFGTELSPEYIEGSCDTGGKQKAGGGKSPRFSLLPTVIRPVSR